MGVGVGIGDSLQMQSIFNLLRNQDFLFCFLKSNICLSFQLLTFFCNVCLWLCVWLWLRCMCAGVEGWHIQFDSASLLLEQRNRQERKKDGE